ncbi:MAG: hypothetical protein IK115_00260 [Lachnospiraceae bacterium]|nr:hypothetical protein [Lachnospiraceae bacterium]
MKTAVRIEKKAHFGDRELRRAVIAPEVSEVEDWAYAACPRLAEVWIPLGCRLSNKAFQDSGALERVFLYETEDKAVNASPELLALSLLSWPSYTAEALEAAADEARFLSWFDDRLKLYLAEADDADYTSFPAGGEEDYDDELLGRGRHIRARRERKAKMCFERLLAKPEAAGEEFAGYLKRYDPDIPFALIRGAGDRRAVYEKLYFKHCRHSHAQLQTLLDCAGDDAELRALIMKELGESSVLDLLEI